MLLQQSLFNTTQLFFYHSLYLTQLSNVFTSIFILTQLVNAFTNLYLTQLMNAFTTVYLTQLSNVFATVLTQLHNFYNTTLLPSVNTIAQGLFCGAKYHSLYLRQFSNSFTTVFI